MTSSSIPLIVLVAALACVEGQKIPVDVAYLADDANDESFARSFIPKYFTNTLKLVQSQADRDKIEFALTVVRTDQTIDRSTINELDKKVALYMGDYDNSFAQTGYLRKGSAPYIITGRSGFLNFMERDYTGKVTTPTCNRTASNDVMSFFPPRTALAHLLLLGCPSYFRRIALIGKNAYQINLILESLHAFGSMCFDLSTFIIGNDWTEDMGMKVLRNALKLKPDAIAIYSFEMDYAVKVFEMDLITSTATAHAQTQAPMHGHVMETLPLHMSAKEANMLTYQHTWFLLHPDIEGIPLYMHEMFKSSYANVTGFQLISRDNFKKFGLEPPRDHIIKHAGILDVMIKLSSTIRDHLAAGKSGRVTSQIFLDWVKGLSWQGYEDTVGFFTDRVEPNSFQSAFCRLSYKVTYYAYEGGKMHMIRDEVNEDYFLVPNQPKEEDLQNRISKEYQIAGSRFKRQTNPRIDVVPSNLTDQPPLPFMYWRIDTPPNMPIFYKDNIRAVAIVMPPMIMEVEDENGKVVEGKYKGMMVDYLKHYSTELNVTYSIDKVVRNRRDLYLALDSGEFDVGIGSLGMSGIRYKQTDYTDTVRLGRIALLVKKAEVKSSPWQFLQPFTWAVWVSLGVVLIVTSILLTLMDILDWTDESFPVRDSFYYTAGLLCAGSTDTSPATVPSRLMICCLMFFAIVVSNSYTANMTAFLTMRKSEDLPQTLQALAAQTAINYSYVKDSEIYRIFTDNENDPYGAIVNRRKTKGIKLFKDINDGVKAVKTKKAGNIGNTILITEEYTAKYFEAKNCDLDVVLQPSEPIYYTIMLPFGATYREDLNEAILAVREGYKDFDTVENYFKTIECPMGDKVAENSKTRRLKWEEMVGVFYVLLMGAGLAIIVGIIGEVYIRVILKKERKRYPWRDFKDECKSKIQSIRNIFPWASSNNSKR